MAKSKNIEEFCPICGSVTKMVVSGEVKVNQEENKYWARCKKCKQMNVVVLKAKNTEKPDYAIENSTEYSPAKSYSIGEYIYHKAWDDFGRVISKEPVSNGNHSILVEFQKSGNKKLLETYISNSKAGEN